MSWQPVAGAPRSVDRLSAYVDREFADLAKALEESYRPIFHVTAERGGLLVAGNYEWAHGNGQSQAIDEGLIIAIPCSLYALSLFLNGASARAKVDVAVGGVLQTDYAIDLTASNQGHIEFPLPLEVWPGDNFAFHTVTQSGTSGNNVVGAWFRTR